jgi:queuosine precursor transporter
MTTRITARSLTAITAYILAITAANWLTTRYGIVPMGFGFATTAGTYAAGLALLLRDTVQDTCGWRWVLAGIGAGAALTALTSPALAVASTVAFLLAELLDMAVYTPLRERGWARAALASGIAGAIVDTYAFLALAGFPITWQTVGGQLVGKTLWATLLPVLLVVTVRQVRRGRLSRHPVGA